MTQTEHRFHAQRGSTQTPTAFNKGEKIAYREYHPSALLPLGKVVQDFSVPCECLLLLW